MRPEKARRLKLIIMIIVIIFILINVVIMEFLGTLVTRAAV